MRKIISIILLVILLSTSVFAESLDANYIDLIFDKVASDNVSQDIVNDIRDLMGSDVGLDFLYIGIISKADSLARYGISEVEVKRNIDALKTWSVEDRKKLIDACANNDRNTVDYLNTKYGTKPPVVTPPVVAPPVVSPPVIGPIIIIEDELNPFGDLSFSKILEIKGFIHGAVSIIPDKMGKTFADTKNHWSNSHVTYLAERGIISGHNDKQFAPEDPITKSEIVALIMKLLVVDATKVAVFEGNVPDIAYGKWYDIAMQNAFTLNLITPNTAGYLEPTHYSSREEVVEILIRSLDALNIEIDESFKTYDGKFSDFDSVNGELKESMAIAVNLGFISGMGDGRIAPKEEITRGQIAAVVKKVYLYILDEIVDSVE